MRKSANRRNSALGAMAGQVSQGSVPHSILSIDIVGNGCACSVRLLSTGVELMTTAMVIRQVADRRADTLFCSIGAVRMFGNMKVS